MDTDKNICRYVTSSISFTDTQNTLISNAPALLSKHLYNSHACDWLIGQVPACIELNESSQASFCGYGPCMSAVHHVMQLSNTIPNPLLSKI